MARATGKDHARVHLDIWGDDDWLDLTPPAQHLYFVLWTSPELSYCGCGPWHPGKIAAKARGWTPATVEQAAAELSAELFLIVDTMTEEFLLRSWIKHDGLWRSPNMAVSMANARAALASRTLRGVVVHEVAKIKARNIAEASDEFPISNSWERDAVRNLLDQKSIDPASLPPFTPTLTPPATPAVTPSATPAVTPAVTLSAGVGVNPPPNPGPTPANAPATTLQRDDDENPVVIAEPPQYFEATTRRDKRHPSAAAKTVVRQELGNAGYPRQTMDRLAVQVDKLAPHHDDAPIREALREWDQRSNCELPEFLPTVLGDVIKRSRARASPDTSAHDAKVNDFLAYAQPQRPELPQ